MNERTIFLAALQIVDDKKRAAFLGSSCAQDLPLRKRVEALLDAHQRDGSFLDIPAVEQMARKSPSPSNPTLSVRSDSRGSPQEPPSSERRVGEHEDSSGVLALLEPSGEKGSLGRLGHYNVQEILGAGGFGVVLRAFDDKLHRMVAIKVMAPHLAATSPPRKRFLREARAAAQIRHENVVAVHAVEETPVPYLVMELVPGGTLQGYIDRTGPLGVAEVLRIGRQVALGLAAAHAQGLIHRDIKPGNVLLETGPGSRIKITDFGLARATDDASLTQSGTICGTPLYMAPEQAQGQSVDQRADLFSLGSVLYAMCTGRPPFRAATTLAVLKRVAEETPRPIQEIIPEIPNGLCQLIARLHAKRPEDRQVTAQQAADLLSQAMAQPQQKNSSPHPPDDERIVPGEPGGTGKNPQSSHGPKPTVRPKRSKGRRWAVAAASLILLFAALGMSEAMGLRGMVLRLFTPEGTLVIESDDPEVSFAIEGSEIVIRGAGVKEIRLRPGQYTVQASKDGKLVSQELVAVTRNGRQVVRVHREAPLAKAKRKVDRQEVVAAADADWEKLAAMKSLRELDIARTAVADLSPLKNAQLQHLICDHTHITDYTPIKDCPLTLIISDFSPKRDGAVLKGIDSLQTINWKSVKDYWNEVEQRQIDKK